MSKNVEKQVNCQIKLYAPRLDADNPYYSPNSRLHVLTGAVQSIRQQYPARIMRLAGGHRNTLEHNCEAVIEIPLSRSLTRESVETYLEHTLKNTQIRYLVTETGEGFGEGTGKGAGKDE